MKCLQCRQIVFELTAVDTALTGLQILSVHSKPAHEIDFRTILDLAQTQALEKNPNVDKYDYSSKEEYNSHYGSLTSREILELIQKSTRNQDVEVHSDNNNYYRASDPINSHKNKQRDDVETYGRYDRYDEFNGNKIDGDDYRFEPKVQHRDKIYSNNDERYKHSRFNELALEELLTENVLDKKYQDKPRKRVVPSNLVGSYDLGNDKSESNGGGYSKVYVILNPQAIEKSKNKDELNSLLVKILSLTASSLGREQGKGIKERRYKGFPVKAGLLARRARHDSREMFAGKDGEEEEYKPKRARGERGGGGGGGRTAIPYIHHRGDIYERDN